MIFLLLSTHYFFIRYLKKLKSKFTTSPPEKQSWTATLKIDLLSIRLAMYIEKVTPKALYSSFQIHVVKNSLHYSLE